MKKKEPIIPIVCCTDYFFFFFHFWKRTNYKGKRVMLEKEKQIYTPVCLPALDLNSISWPPGHGYGVLTYDV